MSLVPCALQLMSATKLLRSPFADAVSTRFVNNAGIAPEAADPRPVWELNVERMWEPTMKINANGVLFGTKYAAKQMIGQEPSPIGDRGSIVNIASVYGLTGNGWQSKCAAEFLSCDTDKI